MVICACHYDLDLWLPLRLATHCRSPAMHRAISKHVRRNHCLIISYPRKNILQCAWSRCGGNRQTGRLGAVAVVAVATAGAEHRRARAAGGDAPAPGKSTSPDPFDWPSMAAARQRRTREATELAQLATRVRQQAEQLRPLAAVAPQQFHAGMRRLRDWTAAESARISFGGGVDAATRRKYAERYGCAAWTEAALRRVAALKVKLIEVGAGAGHWQRALEEVGVDVIAFDNHSTDAPLPHDRRVGRVEFGDEATLDRYPDRALFLCFPPGPPSSMALDCLKRFKGDIVVYVGEGRGGVNASDDFFDALLRDWTVVDVVELAPLPHNEERLFVLERKRSST